MEHALLENHSTLVVETTRPDGTFVRRSAFASAVIFTILIGALVASTPEMWALWPLWMSLWTLVVAMAAATYAIGVGLRRRAGGQSRRTQRWIDAHRS